MRKRRKKTIVSGLFLLGLLGLLGCGSPSSDSASIVPGKNAAFPKDANEKAGAAGISADKATILSLEGTNEAEGGKLVCGGSQGCHGAGRYPVCWKVQ